MRTASLTVAFALISAAACGSSTSTGPSPSSNGTGGTGGTDGTGGQVDTAGVGNGTTTATTGFVDKTLVEAGVAYKYKVFIPASYNTATTVPVILALHSAGDRGSDNLVQTQSGVGRVVRAAPTTFPAIVVFPQAPVGDVNQSHDVFVGIAQLALNLTLAAYKKSDLDRVYLTGYSFGGIAAFDIAYFSSTKFAAFLPISANICANCITGSITTSNAQASALVAAKLKPLPIWQFQGELDTNVPTAQVRQIRDAFVAVNASYTYTELKGLDHPIWDGIYARPDVWTWLWAQHR
jgi:predicted peptidase